jgi:hypothetical protein
VFSDVLFIVITGLVPVIHASMKWIAGTSPAMTEDRMA